MSTDTSSSSWDEDYVQAARLQPEFLKSAELPHPEAPTARYLVAELTGVEEPSPTFILETISALSQSQALPQGPTVVVEQHQPGVNDLMTGAVNPALQLRRTSEELAQITWDDDNATLCSPREIATLNIFNALDNIERLPAGFHTTTLGLKKVWLEIWKGQAHAVYDDEQLLTELEKVGGVPRQQYGGEVEFGVVYPEDLVPCTSESDWDNDHRRYWKLLGDLERIGWEQDEGEQDEDEDDVE